MSPAPPASAFDVLPRPLVVPAARLVVAWSPRAACTHVLVWALGHAGLLAEAEAHGPWPHRYRQDVYYPSAGYREAAARVLAAKGRGHTLLVVGRDPAARLVSIFRHVCRFPILDRHARRRLGLDVRRDGLSLVDLDRILAGLPLAPPSPVDPHLCQQRHPVARLGFDRRITLNIDAHPLETGLHAVEAALGLPATDFAAIPAFARIAESHYARERPYDGAEPIERHRFRAEASRDFPKAALRASPYLARMARRHYGPDFAAMRPGDSAGVLFTAAPGGAVAAAPA